MFDKPVADCALRGTVFNPACPAREILEQPSEKWSLLLLHLLSAGPRRTADLRRDIGGVSEKMLIQTLRKLERNGFVERRAYPEVPPRVDYRLTELGQALAPVVRQFDLWIEQQIPQVLAARQQFDARASGDAP